MLTALLAALGAGAWQQEEYPQVGGSDKHFRPGGNFRPAGLASRGASAGPSLSLAVAAPAEFDDSDESAP